MLQPLPCGKCLLWQLLQSLLFAGLVVERSPIRVTAAAAGEFSSPVSSLCVDSYFGIRSTPVLPQYHLKDPGHSAKSAGRMVQLNTDTHYVCGFELSDTVNWCMVVRC